MQKQKNSIADREIFISRLLNAPVDLVWEVWTNPEHIKHWWGPNGFSNKISKMNVKPGGEWELIMHAPNGTSHQYKCFFREVSKNKKLVYEHLGQPKFIATVEFESRSDKTFIRWQMLFESRDVLVEFVKTHNAKEGIKQNVEKLDHYLSTIKN